MKHGQSAPDKHCQDFAFIHSFFHPFIYIFKYLNPQSYFFLNKFESVNVILHIYMHIYLFIYFSL